VKTPSSRRLVVRTVLIGTILGGCAMSSPVPELPHPLSSGLAIDVALKAPIGLFTRTPDQVYFARIDDEEGARRYQVIPSNYSRSGRAYLLNARPGIYVALGTVLEQSQSMGRPGPSTRFATFFSRELVEQTRVTVPESELAFMGAYVVGNAVGLDGTEGAGARYANALLIATSGDVRYRGTLLERRADEQARDEFFRKAKEDLAGSAWAARIR